MAGDEAFRQQQIERLAQHLLSSVTEDSLGSPIEEDNPLLRIDGEVNGRPEKPLSPNQEASCFRPEGAQYDSPEHRPGERHRPRAGSRGTRFAALEKGESDG